MSAQEVMINENKHMFDPSDMKRNLFRSELKRPPPLTSAAASRAVHDEWN
eukprot:CAMPEP_0174828024 /NCGR_PEP_ID=MMETSP1114-20130205/1088_1 /TAXON_ID=312471 /ORGANISM="Neobodo designis, Strain CCAP 1951/1" /LENGTH=49 /DNA_ID=CAMNT_0016061723 /DNA_START=134 /DNA_END=284 /DNA_ORIENTATION=+